MAASGKAPWTICVVALLVQGVPTATSVIVVKKPNDFDRQSGIPELLRTTASAEPSARALATSAPAFVYPGYEQIGSNCLCGNKTKELNDEHGTLGICASECNLYPHCMSIGPHPPEDIVWGGQCTLFDAFCPDTNGHDANTTCATPFTSQGFSINYNEVPTYSSTLVPPPPADGCDALDDRIPRWIMCSIGAETCLQIAMLLLVSCKVFFCNPRNARRIERITAVGKPVSTKSAIAKVAFDGGHEAVSAAPTEEPAAPEKMYGFKDSEDQLRNECRRLRSDMRIIDCMRSEGVAHTTSKVMSVMHACIRREHGEGSLKLFDQMLEKGAVPDAHLIGKAVSHKFLKLVTDNLDDKRVREDGLRLLDLFQVHGLAPSPAALSRIVLAWDNQLPDSVLNYFLKMRNAGVALTSWRAYGYIVVASERSDPAFALKMYHEMEGLGMIPHRAACNAALGACSQLGMHDAARLLFMQMARRAVVPNERTYSIMIKVYSYSNQPEEAVDLFETMRKKCLVPDGYDYHYAICCCIKLQRMKYAVKLYNDMVQAKVPRCMNTYVFLSEACRKVGWHSLANNLMTDMAEAAPGREA